VNAQYGEILNGDNYSRLTPVGRHEVVCARLHRLVAASVANFSGARLLAPRTRVQLSRENHVSPDLAIVTAATGKLWLAAEIVAREDHRIDTVTKKEIYEHAKLPRLWMIDPRYDNVEIYHATPHGLVLQGILAGQEALTEKLLPEFTLTVAELFASEK
jgi:Uma2 family endonuclease